MSAYSEIIGQSNAMQKIFQTIDRVAKRRQCFDPRRNRNGKRIDSAC
jgi:hypothetical protein